MSAPKSIHPFPARMAPELALRAVQELTQGSVVLDPMMGSGTVVRVAVDAGHQAIGRDVDPLAVLMAKVWTTPIDPEQLRTAARDLLGQARATAAEDVQLRWIDEDRETTDFITYWFGDAQRQHLRQLSYHLQNRTDVVGDALRIAMSRIIITKDRGASLARDVSHSRPHKVAETNTYDVFEGFLESVKRLSRRLEDEPPPGRADVDSGDARQTNLKAQAVDAVVTSPPYLNAIDYLRGHRLALVWFGHSIGELRTIRGGSIGTERGAENVPDRDLVDEVFKRIGIPASFPQRKRRILERYVLDLQALLTEVHRVLKPGGSALFVVGNSSIQNVYVKNSGIVATILNRLGFRHDCHYSRKLPSDRRYLPPPRAENGGDLTRRMRREVILSYTRL
jgi:DNA modification methylase